MKKITQALLAHVLLLIFTLLPAGSMAANQPLPQDQAFKLSTTIKQSGLQVTIDIANGYHLYRDRFHIEANEKTVLGEIKWPATLKKHDEILGDYEAYEGRITIHIPIQSADSTSGSFIFRYQGCADSGFCYPPTTKHIQYDLNQQRVAIDKDHEQLVNETTAQDRFTKTLANKHFYLTLLFFFGFGVLLAFTPCVLPMLPIISGIILGQKKLTHGHAFRLATVYVLSMSLTYAVAGVAAAMLGSSVQAFLQNPWVIGTFSLLFVLLALSLFGFFNLALPERWQSKLTNMSQHQRSGSYLGVFVMGILASLIVSPCVTPPLIGALAYISQTGHALLGGSALFMLGLGMGIPLIIFATAGTALLPKSGPWMERAKQVGGVLLLAVAITLVQRILPGPLTLALWGSLLIVVACFLRAFETSHTQWQAFWKGIGLIIAVLGTTLLIGAALGNDDIFRPLARGTALSQVTRQQDFHRVTNTEQLNQELAQAKEKSQAALLDFYADWCVSCLKIEKDVFQHPTVRTALSNHHLIRIDVTKNNPETRALQRAYGVIAPPAIIFIDKEGKEIKNTRIVGEIDHQDFLKQLSRAKSL